MASLTVVGRARLREFVGLEPTGGAERDMDSSLVLAVEDSPKEVRGCLGAKGAPKLRSAPSRAARRLEVPCVLETPISSSSSMTGWWWLEFERLSMRLLSPTTRD
jgi:hypothetical protein